MSVQLPPGLFAQFARIVRQDVKEEIARALQRLGIVGSTIDLGNTGGVIPPTSMSYSSNTPAAVAAAGVVGTATDGAPHSSHVHPHGSGYLPDAHHDKSHAHNGDGSGSVAHSSLTGLTAGNDHTQYVRKDTLTTKGDVYAATGAGAPARVGVGSNGQVLTADSAQSAGVGWNTPSAGVSALDDLTDVVITAPALYNRLRYDGSVWRNSQLAWVPLSDGAADPALVFAAGDVILVEATP